MTCRHIPPTIASGSLCGSYTVDTVDRDSYLISMMASGFELINLGATIAEPQPVANAPESSDDALDPHEFLSQSHMVAGSQYGSRNNTVSPIAIEGLDLTPTILNSEFYANPGRLSDSDHMWDSTIADSFHFVSSASIYRYAHDRLSSEGESPLNYLQRQNEALEGNMRKYVRALRSTLDNGDDCAAIRSTLASGLDQLSENCYLLHEIYEKEFAFVGALLKNFESWDRRRSKVLRRIRSIKSDDNEYGNKLAGLLNKRSAIDEEIELLESRIAALKFSRGAINKEIDETSSVLESKSAKYVNIFRDLEKQGKEAISEYLYSTGLPEQHLRVLLKSEPVEAAFSYANQAKPSTAATTEKKANGSSNKESPKPKESHKPRESPKPKEVLTKSIMGIQPLEIPDDDPGVPQAERETAYEKGYAKGAEQLERILRGLNRFVSHVFSANEDEVKPRIIKSVDDSLNTITEKINLVPIIELLTHKMDALTSLKLKTSKLSAEFHDQSAILKDVYKNLDLNERALITQLSEPLPSTDSLLKILTASYQDLKQNLNTQINQQKSKSRELKNYYLTQVLYFELRAIARTMSELTHDSTPEDELPQLNNSMLETSSVGSSSDRRTSYEITSFGFKPHSALPIAETKATARGSNARISSPLPGSSKDMKYE